MPKTLILADDHRILRDGLRAIFEQQNRYRIVGEAGDGMEAIRLCRTLQPDLAIIDSHMPILSGLDVAAEIQHSSSGTRVLVLSSDSAESNVLQAVRFGVKGFVLKTAPVSELLQALETVSSGGTFVSPEVSSILLNCIRRGEAPQTGHSLHGLSPRELQVLRLIAEGRTSRDIAAILDLGLETVRSYRKTLMRKTRVNNIAGLTQLALSAGIRPGREDAASASA